MNKIASLLCLSAVLIFSAAQVNAQRVTGNGNVVSQDRNTKSFSGIHSRGSFNVVITDGNEQKVRVEAEENLQEYITVEVQGDELVISTKKLVNIRATKNMTVYVTAHGLKSVKLSGSGNVKSTNTLTGSDEFEAKSSGSGNITLDVETNSLDMAISGSGNMTLKGKTKNLDGSISGSGNIRAKNLQADVASIKISGSGDAELVANEKLDSRIAGSGSVRYWGNAAVSTKIAGSGSVHRQQ
jgi:hypothetical protein